MKDPKKWARSGNEFALLDRARPTVLGLPQPLPWVVEVSREEAENSFLGAAAFLLPTLHKSLWGPSLASVLYNFPG